MQFALSKPFASMLLPALDNLFVTAMIYLLLDGRSASLSGFTLEMVPRVLSIIILGVPFLDLFKRLSDKYLHLKTKPPFGIFENQNRSVILASWNCILSYPFI